MTTYRDKLVRSFCKRMTLESLKDALEKGIDAITVIQELAAKEIPDVIEAIQQEPDHGTTTIDTNTPTV